MSIARAMPNAYIPIMPKRSSKEAPSDDPNVTAKRVLDRVIEETDQNGAEAPEPQKPRKKNRAAVALGRLGGKKGGPARARKLTAERRRDIAQRAARARWGPAPGEQNQRDD